MHAAPEGDTLRSILQQLLKLPRPSAVEWAAVLLTFAGVCWLAPVLPQPNSYHDFADKRVAFGIPHFGDVVTNVPFGVVGAAALRDVLTNRRLAFRAASEHLERPMYMWLFAALASVMVGSGLYHLHPCHTLLLGDRLSMTLAYGALLPITAAERWSPQLGARLFWPTMALCVGSALYWIASEWAGRGNMVPYALAQGGVLLGWGALMVLKGSAYTQQNRLWAAFALGCAMKMIEVLDRPIFWLTFKALSGHSIHHLLAAWAEYDLAVPPPAHRACRRCKAATQPHS